MELQADLGFSASNAFFDGKAERRVAALEYSFIQISMHIIQEQQTQAASLAPLQLILHPSPPSSFSKSSYSRSTCAYLYPCRKVNEHSLPALAKIEIFSLSQQQKRGTRTKPQLGLPTTKSKIGSLFVQASCV